MTLTFRQCGMTDPAVRAQLIALTQTIFGISLQPLTDLDAWSPGYQAFSYLEGEQMVANVSIRPLRLRVAGLNRDFMQVHAVSTLPEMRRRGLFGGLMARALQWANARAEGVFLFTGAPEIYARFGFRTVAEHRFQGRLAAAPAKVESRLLDLRRAADVALIHRLAAGQAAVSDRLGVYGNGDVILWNLWHQPRWRLSYLPRREALVVHDGARLIDVLATVIPPEAEIAGVIGRVEIDVRFAPDRFAGPFVPKAHVGDDLLMVRGPWTAEPSMLPPTASG